MTVSMSFMVCLVSVCSQYFRPHNVVLFYQPPFFHQIMLFSCKVCSSGLTGGRQVARQRVEKGRKTSTLHFSSLAFSPWPHLQHYIVRDGRPQEKIRKTASSISCFAQFLSKLFFPLPFQPSHCLFTRLFSLNPSPLNHACLTSSSYQQCFRVHRGPIPADVTGKGGILVFKLAIRIPL